MQLFLIIKHPYSSIAEPDGMMQGDEFVRRLLSLQPLPRISPESRLQESEPEDEDEEEEEEEESDAYDHDDEDRYHDDDVDEDDFYNRSAPKPNTSESGQSAPVVAPRSYALYAADDDDTDDSEDEVPISLARTSGAKLAAPPVAHKTRSPYVPKGDSGPNVVGSYGIQETRYGQATVSKSAYSKPGHGYVQARLEAANTPSAPVPMVPVATAAVVTAMTRSSEPTVGRYNGGDTAPIPRAGNSVQIDRPGRGVRTASTYSSVPGTVKVEPVIRENRYDSEPNIEERDAKGLGKVVEEVIWEMDDDEDAHSSTHQLNQPTGTATFESQRIEDLYVEGFSQMPAVGSTISLVSAQEPADIASRPQTCLPSNPSRSDLSAGDEEDDILCLEVGDLDAF